MTQQQSKPRTFSGIQPTGKLHLGNYVGAVSKWVENQDAYDSIYCIADLHALTVPDSHEVMPIAYKVRHTAALLIACGLDPDRSAIFVQSYISAHTELAWILNCLTPVSWLERMTQYKAKAAVAQSASAGLLDYPVLQAADILLYQTDLVPVGEDQKQHIELTVSLAQRFNRLFGDVFVIPKPLIRKTGARIMGFDDPSIKMSKSLAEHRRGHTISLADPPDVIRQTILEAVTDSGAETRFAWASPGVKNLLTLFEVLSGKSRSIVESHFEGKGYQNLKTEVADLVIAILAPVRVRYLELVNNPVYLNEILQQGCEKVSPIAFATLDKAKRSTGIKNERSSSICLKPKLTTMTGHSRFSG